MDRKLVERMLEAALNRASKNRIEELERELVEWKDRNEKSKTVAANATVLASDRGFEIESLQAELAAEKALADRFGLAMNVSNSELQAALLAWRKARGL